jgi:hypothetical protein
MNQVAKGKIPMETQTQPISIPKSRPIRECMSKIIVLVASSTTNEENKAISIFLMWQMGTNLTIKTLTYCDEGAKRSPI